MNKIINNVMLVIVYFGSNYAAERQNRNNDKIHQKIQNQDSCKSSNILRNILTQSYNTGLSVNTHFNANYQKTLSMGLEENEFSENMQQQIEDQTNISQRIDDDPMLDYGFMMDAPFPDDPTRDIEEVLVPSTANISSIKSSPYHLAYISPRTDPLRQKIHFHHFQSNIIADINHLYIPFHHPQYLVHTILHVLLLAMMYWQ